MTRRSNIRPLLLCSLLLSGLFVPQQTAGQVVQRTHTKTVNMVATAAVMDNLALTTIRDVNLDGPSTVDGLMQVSPVASPYAGLMRITGAPNRAVRVTYLTNETLIDEGGSGAIIKATYLISGFGGDNQNASILLDVGEATVRLNQSGEYYLWLGAMLDLTAAGPGSYVSEFIMEIEGN
jgi:hypothetical protein